MKLVFRYFQPKTDKERMFHIEADVNDLKTPGEAYVVIEGKEYLVEVHY
jgi:hypothetical protein